MKTGGPRVLIVDDESEVRALCREFLEENGYSVDEAVNGSEALEKMEKSSYCVVVSDVVMPDINGLELTSIVTGRFPDTFVILITGYGTIDLAKDAIHRGAFDLITKPFDMNELMSIMTRAVRERRKLLAALPSQELSDLYDLTVKTDVSEQSPDDYLSSLSKCILKTFKGDLVRIYLADEPDGPMTRRTGAGEEDILPGEEWEKLEAAMEIDQGILKPGRDVKGAGNDALAASIMAVPIFCSQGRLGSCIVGRASSPVEFNSRDLKLLKLFAALAGNQVANYRMALDLRDQTETLRKVNIVAGGFSSTLSISRVLKSISRGLRSMLDFDLFGVLLCGENMPPLSYILARADMPGKVIQDSLRKVLERSHDKDQVNLFLDWSSMDAFVSLSIPDWSSEPRVEILDLGDFTTLKGMVVLADWSGRFCGGESSYVTMLLRHAAAALGNAYLFETNQKNYFQTIAALAGAVDAKDRYTLFHSRNVAAYVVSMASHMRFSPGKISLLNSAALLHDIGKIGIPESILNKNGPLTDKEFGIIKTHPSVGYSILRPVTAFGGFIEAVKHHHERYDGRGYPDGIAGEEIPLEARIITIADSFDAMTSERIYRKAPGLEYAVSEIRKNLGFQFDPRIGEIFLSILCNASPEELVAEYLAWTSNQPVSNVV